MARHFLSLYFLIVLALAAFSWGQDKLLHEYGPRDVSGERASAVALLAGAGQLQSAPADQWRSQVDQISAKTGGSYELFSSTDITGRKALAELRQGEIAYMQDAASETWALKQLNRDYILAFKSPASVSGREPLEWVVTILFYAVMALVIMIWIWPLTRDLRALENAVARFGNRNWEFAARIKPRSQVYALAETFRKMALRIDGLIASHQDMTNAVSHEIRTPLSRMQFEIELAQESQTVPEIKSALHNIKADIAAINALVSATLDYAILERANFSLNVGTYNFTTLLPAIAESVGKDARPGIHISTELSGATDNVLCDLHLMETVVKNLLYNAVRYAKREIRLAFTAGDGVNAMSVDDDGPGIPEKDWRRVFGSFVKLDSTQSGRSGFGLGLAIVKRCIEWHDGEVAIANSALGGARISATWPAIMDKGSHGVAEKA